MKTLKACFKFFLFFLLCILVVPTQTLLLLFHRGKGAYVIPQLWQRAVCKIFQIQVVYDGHRQSPSQTIYISNHLSYLDIPAIASILKASFVAKKEVASWPVFGYLSKLQQTAFISRNRSDVAQGKYALDTMLKDGKSLIIFPEGTSTDGTELIPFKSSLFSIALREDIPDLQIVPVSLSMRSVDGHDIKTQKDRDLYAWHRNMDTPMALHLWTFAKSRGALIHINFHPPLNAADFSDRKALANTCYHAVLSGLNITQGKEL